MLEKDRDLEWSPSMFKISGICWFFNKAAKNVPFQTGIWLDNQVLRFTPVQLSVVFDFVWL